MIYVHGRVFALYDRRRILMVVMIVYYFAELIVALWTYSVPGSHRKCLIHSLVGVVG